MIVKGISIALLALLALCPVTVAQDSGIQDSLIITCYDYPTSPPDSFALVLRVFTDDTLFLVSAVINYNTSELVATSVSEGPLIEGMEGSALSFQNFPSESRFAVTWIGNDGVLMQPGYGVFAIVYFQLLDNFRCSAPPAFDTCSIPPVTTTMFFKIGQPTFVPFVVPLLINCVGAASDVVQIHAAGHVSTVHPNPFNSGTTIELDMPSSYHLSIVIYDILGRRVRTIADGFVTHGPHQFPWDGTNGTGQSAASGVYFARITIGSDQVVRKLVLLR